MLNLDDHPLAHPNAVTEGQSRPPLHPKNLSPEELVAMRNKAVVMIERAQNNRTRIINRSLQRKPLPERSMGDYTLSPSPTSRRESFGTAPKDILGVNPSPKIRSRTNPRPIEDIRESSTTAETTYVLRQVQPRQSFDTISESDYGSLGSSHAGSYAASHRSGFTDQTGMTTPRMGSIDMATPKQRVSSLDTSTPLHVGSIDMMTPRLRAPMDAWKYPQEVAQIPDLVLPVAMLEWEKAFSGVQVVVQYVSSQNRFTSKVLTSAGVSINGRKPGLAKYHIGTARTPAYR